MVESGVAGVGPGNVSGAKKAAKAKKPRAKPTHPPTADMVNAAIEALKERGGSSLQAVKKYIASTYKVDVEKQAPFIKKYLKSAVTSGQLVQTKGKGAAGSFRLALGKQDNASKSKAGGGGGTVRKKATPKKTSTTPKKTVKSAKKVTIKKSSTTVTAKKPSVKSIGEKRKSAAVKRPAVKPPKAKTTAAPAKSKTVKSKKPSVKKTPVKAKARKPVAKKPAATASRKKK